MADNIIRFPKRRVKRALPIAANDNDLPPIPVQAAMKWVEPRVNFGPRPVSIAA